MLSNPSLRCPSLLSRRDRPILAWGVLSTLAPLLPRLIPVKGALPCGCTPSYTGRLLRVISSPFLRSLSYPVLWGRAVSAQAILLPSAPPPPHVHPNEGAASPVRSRSCQVRLLPNPSLTNPKMLRCSGRRCLSQSKVFVQPPYRQISNPFPPKTLHRLGS